MGRSTKNGRKSFSCATAAAAAATSPVTVASACGMEGPVTTPRRPPTAITATRPATTPRRSCTARLTDITDTGAIIGNAAKNKNPAAMPGFLYALLSSLPGRRVWRAERAVTRTSPGNPRLSLLSLRQGVDARHKAGHDRLIVHRISQAPALPRDVFRRVFVSSLP